MQDKWIPDQVRDDEWKVTECDDIGWNRHCERRIRAAIQSVTSHSGLLRSARNDEVGQSKIIML
jgi:hypothetical protein